jgi:hypothetical protein
MTFRLARLAAVLFAVCAFGPGASLHAQTTSPYRDLVWADSEMSRPNVLVGDEWFELIAFDGVGVPDLIAFARATYGDEWERRFSEDMETLLRLMGRQPGGIVSLELRNTQTGETLTRTDVLMTRPNRAELMALRRERQGRARPAGAPAASTRSTRLSASQIAQDLADFQREIEERWAYLEANDVDYAAAVARVRDRAADGMDLNDYGRQLHLIVARFIDGHARVSGFSFPVGSMPFILEPADGRYVALQLDRAAFIDPERPFVTRIEGRPLSDWFAAVAPYVVRGSPQLVEKESVERIQQLWVREQLFGGAQVDSVRLELVARDGSRPREVTLGMSNSGRLPPTAWPATRSRIIGDDIGYLRLPNMDEAAVEEVRTWMPQLSQTRGLIVDVRGNSGGSRDALRAFFPYLMSEGDAPRVVNAAKHRLHGDYGASDMGGDRYMYPESWSGWTPEERGAIARFKTSFRPQWSPPEEKFSDWFYLVMSRAMNPEAYFYDRPVVVLLDAHSFSATDIFVSALKGWRNVTLVGTPSGGGSALQRSVRLPVSGLSLSLASMASFQASGRLFDGNGTQPDVVVQPNPEYYLVGGRDDVLERAIQMLRSAP